MGSMQWRVSSGSEKPLIWVFFGLVGFGISERSGKLLGARAEDLAMTTLSLSLFLFCFFP